MTRATKIETLKHPREFKRVRGGVRWATELFIIEGRRRGAPIGGASSNAPLDSPTPGPAVTSGPHVAASIGEFSPPLSSCSNVASALGGPRFGFTITRKVGPAVVRNRIRRRLKEALRTLDAAKIRPDHDYVVVASRAAHDYPFARLQDALREAFDRLARQTEGGPRRARSTSKSKAGRPEATPGDRADTRSARLDFDGPEPSTAPGPDTTAHTRPPEPKRRHAPPARRRGG